MASFISTKSVTIVPRRALIFFLAAAFLLVLFLGLPSSDAGGTSSLPGLQSSLSAGLRAKHASGPIASALGNETAKAELGRASWKLFHTMMARFPDKPSQDDQESLEAYVYLFARLYPCGECAGHFQKILRKFPPQTSSRSSAAAWACSVHNVVNKSLGKDLFDCTKIGDFYHCGCAEEAGEEAKKLGEEERGQRAVESGNMTMKKLKTSE